MFNKFPKVKLPIIVLSIICLLLIAFLLYKNSNENNSKVTEGSLDENVAFRLPDIQIDEKELPVSLNIPAINLKVPFGKPLGLTQTGEVELPDGYNEVGWYKFGPTPGKLGPAVILGHVDSKNGPAVFFSLGQLKIGDEISVEQADGTIFHFVVEDLERVQQDTFPTTRVYGDIDYAGLRLITCSGTYLRGEKRYSHNLIVYARRVEK